MLCSAVCIANRLIRWLVRLSAARKGKKHPAATKATMSVAKEAACDR